MKSMKKAYFVNYWLILIFLLNSSILTLAQNLNSDDENNSLTGNCTSIMVGRLATTDGSVITSHTCDGPYRTWVEVFPHAKYEKGTTHSVYTGTLDPRETSWDMRNVTKTGEIPEAEETYAFLNTAYPCLNEKQLAIGETTIRGRPELRNKDGILIDPNKIYSSLIPADFDCL
jgi:hypothetical protein